MELLYNKVKVFVGKYELLILFIIVLIILLKWISFPFINIISIVVLLSISSMYMASGIGSIDKGGVLSKISGMASGVTIVGVLFSLLHWPNSIVMLLVGSLALIGVLIRASTLKLLKTEKFTQNKVVRLVVLIVLSGFFLFGIV